MKPTPKKVLILFMLAALVFAGWLASRTSQQSASPGDTCDPGVSLDTPQASAEVPAAKADVADEGKVVLPRLVDLGSDTCVPCKMMVPVLEDLTKTYEGKLTVEFINISENREAAAAYQVRAIPTQVFYDTHGREFYRHLGYYPKEDIVAKFKEQGIDLDKGK